MTPKQRSPHSSPYALASPSPIGRLTPGVFRAREEGGESNYVMRSAVNGPLLSSCVRTYPDISPQTSPWVTFDSASCGPGAIGQERHSPLSPSNPGHQIPRTLSRPGGRHVRAHSGGHHNVVDIDRIRKGADVRTTVCSSLPIPCNLALTMPRSCYGTSPTRLTRYVARLSTCFLRKPDPKGDVESHRGRNEPRTL